MQICNQFWWNANQGICDILVPGEFINDDTLTIICEMTLPGNDVTKLGYTYNAEVTHSKYIFFEPIFTFPGLKTSGKARGQQQAGFWLWTPSWFFYTDGREDQVWRQDTWMPQVDPERKVPSIVGLRNVENSTFGYQVFRVPSDVPAWYEGEQE